jgi:MFS family permease
MLVAFALSSLATGILSDLVGRRRAPTLAFGAVHVLCWIPWIAAPVLPLAATLPLVVLMGASATGFTLSWASVKEVNPPALSGTAMAVVNTGVFLGPTIYQPLVGWILDRAGFRAGLAVLAAFSLTGLLAALLVRETRCRNVAAEEVPPAPG